MTFDEPYFINCADVVAFDICDSGIYYADYNGELFFSSFQRENMRGERVNIGEKIRHINCGMDFCIVVTWDKCIFGKGDNSQRQLTSQNQSNYPSFSPLEVAVGE